MLTESELRLQNGWPRSYLHPSLMQTPIAYLRLKYFKKVGKVPCLRYRAEPNLYDLTTAR